jgi:hypothetical protein
LLQEPLQIRQETFPGGEMNIYWYISKAKLDLLKDQSSGFLSGITGELSLKLPFVSGSLSGTGQSRLVKDLQRIIKRLKADCMIKSFADLGDTESPIVMAFAGNAARQISEDVFWLAIEQGESGLLLAGSAGFAIGASSKPEHYLSPSADPVGAVKAAFKKDEELDSLGTLNVPLSTSLSYAWRTLMLGSSEGSLPRVSGLAIFARTVKSDKSQVGKSNVQRIVVGTPIYVQQV